MEQTLVQELLENEEAIIERAKKDDQAFEVLYSHYFPKIYGYIFKRTGNREAAEDIVSATFLKVFTNLKKYDHRGYTFGAWVYKIATNNLVDYYRKQGKAKEVAIEEAHEVADLAAGPAEEMYQRENENLVKSILAKMPPKYQQVLYLKFFAEVSTPEMAESLKITENNARVLLYRALKKFHILYEKR